MIGFPDHVGRTIQRLGQTRVRFIQPGSLVETCRIRPGRIRFTPAILRPLPAPLEVDRSQPEPANLTLDVSKVTSLQRMISFG
jgi:hypothetical protein